LAIVASQARTSANSRAIVLLGTAAKRGGELTDLLGEPHEGPLDAPGGILLVVHAAG
jgi:hypothetical protein